jgi:endonuclease/exonuclease/phosphatase family metal-dependent hydrolase
LNQTGTQVTDTTIRNGIYANANQDGPLLIMRHSTADRDYERRAILKFDTQNTIPAYTKISSATLTLTVKSGMGTAGEKRPVTAYRITQPFQEAQATWKTRQGTYAWVMQGADMAEQVAIAGGGASNVPGSKVTFDVTTLVQNTLNGKFDSRYTRIGLIDVGTDVIESYREYYASEDVDPAKRPTLTVVLATSVTSTPPPPPPSTPPPPPSTPPPSPSGTTSTLKVLQWNVRQGYGIDMKSNIDRVVAFIVSKRPDIISFNEICQGGCSPAGVDMPKTIAAKLTAQTGQTWTYNWVKGGEQAGEGECVMTHLGIDASDDYYLDTVRSVAMARVMVNGRILNFFSTHLDQKTSATRLAEVKKLVSWAVAESEQRIVAGDFNSWPGPVEITEMGKTYTDSWVAATSKGTAVSAPGHPYGVTKNTRLDYVWSSKGAAAVSVTRAEVIDTIAMGISDHRALLVTLNVN